MNCKINAKTKLNLMNGFGCKSTHTTHSKVCHFNRRSWSLEQHFSTISMWFPIGSAHYWRVAKCHFLSHLYSQVNNSNWSEFIKIRLLFIFEFSFFELKVTTKRALCLWLTWEDANTRLSNQFWKSYKTCKFVIFFFLSHLFIVSFWIFLFEGNLQLSNLSRVHYQAGHVLAKAKDLVRQFQVHIWGLFFLHI